MTIEKLTDEEREALAEGVGDYQDEAKALRIIDAQAAVIERVRACPRHSVAGTLYVAWVDLDEALAAAPEHTGLVSMAGYTWVKKEALDAANARVAELEAMHAALRAEQSEFRAALQVAQREADDLRSSLAAADRAGLELAKQLEAEK